MLDMRDSNFPHIKFIDLRGNGVMEEVAVMKVFENQDVAYIPISSLDPTDKSRLLKIVTSEHARMFELHELMKSHTLKNGMNALEFFQQLVRVRTASGQLIDANPTRRGAGQTQAQVAKQESTQVLKKKKVLLSEPPSSTEV